MSDRCSWTLEEEDVTINILEGIVANGGRCDTGSFRTCTYEHVALKIREKIENITITAKHVQHKDRYSAAYDMLNTSGFSWDDTHKYVTVDSLEILEDYLADALYHMGLENDESDTFGFIRPLSIPSNVASASSTLNIEQTLKQKRKRNDGTTVVDITNVFEKSIGRASTDIAKLTKSITEGDTKTRLGVELEGIGLDHMQVIRVTMYFRNKTNQLRIWNDLNDSYKLDFVKTNLEE
ncbi:hypothetical protein Ddye_016470 [Dipteronia dyeriana]|uniref:Myb/SANT-like domain-containing protein n=1 Tax=Dipteronia dyeriana TaxID=168575 RepID=A0AAD9U7G9_9ROSI|nr:hypothetical protein Ddye_016470 [Dipteronia dyeriana]